MKPKPYTIQELSELSGFSRRTIRYYIQEGLIEPPAGRGRGGFYYDSHLNKLSIIRQLQNQGLKLSTISKAFKEAEIETLSQTTLQSDEEPFAEHDAVTEYKAAKTASEEDKAAYILDFLRSTHAKMSPQSPSREVWVRYPVSDGIALHIRRDIDIHQRKKIDQVIRLVDAIMNTSAKGEGSNE